LKAPTILLFNLLLIHLIAKPFGWHDVDGIAGADFDITRGNNVWAKEDFGSNKFNYRI
jgi:hypothetical protein